MSMDTHISTQFSYGQDELRAEIQKGTLDPAYEPIRFGNTKGLAMMEKLDSILRCVLTLSTLKEQFKQFEQRQADFKAELKDLKNQVSLLASASEGYLNFRNRFFAVFLPDCLDRESEDDHKAINNGNLNAHAGDVLTDALLFEKGGRRDTATFQLLDGFMPRTVIMRLEDHDDTLNFTSATKGTDIHLEKNRKTPLGQLHVAFLGFVSAVRQEGFRSDYLSDLSAPETIAYWSFFDKLAKVQAIETQYQ